MQEYNPSSLSVKSVMVRLSEPKINLKKQSIPTDGSAPVSAVSQRRKKQGLDQNSILFPPLVIGQLVVVFLPDGGGHQRRVVFHLALKHHRPAPLDHFVLQVPQEAGGF